MSLTRRFSYFSLGAVGQAIVAFAMVPIVTGVVGPHEIGVYALVAAFSGIVSTLSTLGSGYLLAERFLRAGSDERRRLVSTCVATTLLAAALLVLLLVAAFAEFRAVPPADSVPVAAVVLAAAATLLGAPWSIASDVLTLEGRARGFAATVLASSLASAVAVAASLYIFHLDLLALFVGLLASSCTFAIASVLLLRAYLGWTIDRWQASEVARIGVIAGVGSLLEAGHPVVERMLLSSGFGFVAVGLYSHSQQYRGGVASAVKALARSVWPVSLAEAKQPETAFATTRAAWNLVHVGVIAVGLVFATLGKEIVAVLTHGKFTDVWWIAALWMGYILVQNSGKPQMAVLYSRGRGAALSRLTATTSGLGIVALLALVPWLGIAGAFVAEVVRMTAFRVGMQWQARRLVPAPFHDGWVVAGCGLILTTVFIVAHWNPTLPFRLVLLVGIDTALLVAARGVLAPAFGILRGLFGRAVSAGSSSRA